MMSSTIENKESKGNSEADDKPRKRGGKGKKRTCLSHLAQLNPTYHKDEFKRKLAAAFKEKSPLVHENKASFDNKPFCCCTLPNFVKNDQFLEGLKGELLDQIFYEKNNDLYKFQQSEDLKKISTPHVRALRKLLHEEFRDWLKDVTNIPFSDQVDITCSRYDHTDTLLCHDDELEGRRIAFILYLVPPWKTKDGGCLDLFDLTEHGEPKDVVKSLVPEWNKFVFFEVTAASYHQVAEVLTEDKTRLSVNGWFHGPPIAREPAYVEPALPLTTYTSVEEHTVYEWINPIYLDPEVQAQIQEKFENDSEIELQGFLKEDKYQALAKAVKSPDICWRKTGPPNKRNYLQADPASHPQILQECLNFFCSEAMFLTLSNLTGLSLHELAARTGDSDEDTCSHAEAVGDGDMNIEEAASPSSCGSCSDSEGQPDKTLKNKRRRLNTEEGKTGEGSTDDRGPGDTADCMQATHSSEKKGNPRCRSEVRKWQHGSYTLLHDTDSGQADFALDAMLFCSCKGWQSDYGGSVSYIAKGEDEELLTVNPAENSLALVYRDKDTLRFVKYINSKINSMQNGAEYYDLSLVYYE